MQTNKIKKAIRKVAILSLAVYGSWNLLTTKIPDFLERLDPLYRNSAGQLENGLTYKIKTDTEFDKDPKGYFINFGDGITVNDIFRDGTLFCYDINNHKRLRILSKAVFEGRNNSPCVEGTYIIDDKLRAEVIRRVGEVYAQQKIPAKVKDGYPMEYSKK